MNEFDFEGVFNDDYLHFYEQILTPERTAEDVEKIVELLELQAGAEVLDCPCGHGRIANALAERGFRVTGIDASEFFLDRARADAQVRGVAVEYTQGDMRSLPWRGRFDAL
ncbi:MAG: class I SAM-dependent methyltransferase, partial [Gaiellales bacterium]